MKKTPLFLRRKKETTVPYTSCIAGQTYDSDNDVLGRVQQFELEPADIHLPFIRTLLESSPPP
jgi:hypothetical protein